MLSHDAVASTTQTGPRANVIGWPDRVVNVGADLVKVNFPQLPGGAARVRRDLSP